MDVAWALDQISGWQTARTKLPEWAAADGIIYPSHLSMEQCSSESTAKYKAQVVASFRPPSNSPEGESSLIDLTGGFGVDFSYMAKDFRQAVYVERNPELCEIARHNFRLLGLENAEIVCGDGVEYLKTLPSPSNPLSPNTHHPSPVTIYLDPARRDFHGQKTYAISDCTPDVLRMKDELLIDLANSMMDKWFQTFFRWRRKKICIYKLYYCINTCFSTGNLLTLHQLMKTQRYSLCWSLTPSRDFCELLSSSSDL